MITLHRQDGVVERFNSMEELNDEVERRWEEHARREELRATPEGRRTLMAERLQLIEGPREKLFRAYLANGKDALGEDHEARALSEGTGSAGGYLVASSFYGTFLAALKKYDGIFDAASVLPTTDGTQMSMPLDDDSGQSSSVIAESGSSTAVDSVYDQVSWAKTPMHRSGEVRYPIELAQDSFFDMPTMLARSFARRFARGVGATHTATLLTAAALGKTAAAVNAVTGDELLDLVSSVDPAYAQNGAFLLNLATMTSLRKLKGATSGDYLLDIDTDAQGRPTIFGYTCYISPSMPNMTTGQKTILFGDLSRFYRREGPLVTKVSIERYAELGQRSAQGFWRVDGQLAKSANSPVPVKYLQQA